MTKGPWSIPEIKFVVFWTIATASGAFLALLISQILLIGIEKYVQFPLDEVLFGCMLGLFLGAGQWVLLHQQVARSGWWVLSSMIGGTIVGFVANLAGNQANSLITFGAYGIILGTLQWTAVRGKLPRLGIWILANGAAWALGSQSMVWIDRISLDPSWPFNELITVAIMYGLLGELVGVITGSVLVWMIRNLNDSSRPSTEKAKV